MDPRDRCPDCGSEGHHGCGFSEFTAEARQVQPGDLLGWCGRWVTVGSVELVRPRGTGTQKPGRYFHVTVPGHEDQRLHYFYNERVAVRRPVAAPSDASTPEPQ